MSDKSKKILMKFSDSSSKISVSVAILKKLQFNIKLGRMREFIKLSIFYLKKGTILSQPNRSLKYLRALITILSNF